MVQYVEKLGEQTCNSQAACLLVRKASHGDYVELKGYCRRDTLHIQHAHILERVVLADYVYSALLVSCSGKTSGVCTKWTLNNHCITGIGNIVVTESILAIDNLACAYVFYR